MAKNAINTGEDDGTGGPAFVRRIHPKLANNSAVSIIAGRTIENAIVQSELNWSVENNSRPRYCQFAVRRLISSNNHQTGADKQNSRTKSLRERDHMEVRVRV